MPARRADEADREENAMPSFAPGNVRTLHIAAAIALGLMVSGCGINTIPT